jgi:hypothetical protein
MSKKSAVPKELDMFKNKTVNAIKDLAKQYSVTLTRKLPNSKKLISKGVGELVRETESRIKNWSKADKKDRCYKPTVAINEKYLHNNKPCKEKEERTKNFCVKKLNKVDEKKVKWERTLSPNKNTRITIVCPK